MMIIILRIIINIINNTVKSNSLPCFCVKIYCACVVNITINTVHFVRCECDIVVKCIYIDFSGIGKKSATINRICISICNKIANQRYILYCKSLSGSNRKSGKTTACNVISRTLNCKVSVITR